MSGLLDCRAQEINFLAYSRSPLKRAEIGVESILMDLGD